MYLNKEIFLRMPPIPFPENGDAGGLTRGVALSSKGSDVTAPVTMLTYDWYPQIFSTKEIPVSEQLDLM